MSPYFAFALLLSVAILQTTIMPRLSVGGVAPDLMLLVVVSWSLLRIAAPPGRSSVTSPGRSNAAPSGWRGVSGPGGAGEGIIWALGGGLLLDLLSGGPFGAITIALVLSSLVVSLGARNLSRGTLWLPLFASALATAIYSVTYLIILRISGRPVLWVPSLLLVVVPSMGLNALAMYPVHWAMRWLERRTNPAPVA